MDNQDRKAKQTDDERQHRQLTNRSGKDDVHTEGNVAAVDCSAGLPTVTIASRDGAVTVVLLHDAATVCSSIQVGDYLEADGTKQTEQRFEADDVDVTRGRRAP